LYALDHPEFMVDQIKIVKQDRELAYNGLFPLVKKGIISVAYPKTGFYLFVKTLEKDCTDMVMDILKTAKVALAPGIDFAPFSAHSFRLCYARDPKLVQEGIARLVKYFEEKYL
jgi:aspartate/methionine/tyrosine aminotransferase